MKAIWEQVRAGMAPRYLFPQARALGIPLRRAGEVVRALREVQPGDCGLTLRGRARRGGQSRLDATLLARLCHAVPAT